MYSLAILGGTFDPVHNGHLKTSITIQEQFQFDSYRFLPCKIPTLKPSSVANSEQRIAMLELAIEKHSGFSIDLREINRETPSYMVDTLKSLRLEYQNASITLVLGYDAFLSLPKWHQWEQLINLANLLVINRSSCSTLPIPPELNTLLTHCRTTDRKLLLAQASGLIYEFDAGNYAISSTEIRDALKKQVHLQTQLPNEVYAYIKQLGLYR